MSTKTDSVRLYKVRKLISELADKEGRGTELISLYVPPKKPLHEVISNLREEWGTAGNIKSDTTRNHVQDALVRTMQRLKLYKTTPENGLVIFAGALPTNGPGSEVINLHEITPPKPVGTYLYQCLAPDTAILLGDGRQETMKELKGHWSGDIVMCYDFENRRLANSPIRRYVSTRVGDRKSYRLTTESGRKILATEDHPFWTPKGWMRLGELKPGDFVCVFPLPDLGSHSLSTASGSIRTIVDEDSIRTVPAPPRNLELAIRRLKQRGLLPLTEDNPNLPVIARILGHLFSDGSMSHIVERRKSGPYSYFTIDCCLGSQVDEDELRKEVANLGYEPPKGREVTYTMRVDGREYTARTRHVKLRDSALCSLLRALGAPVGEKVKNGAKMPEWLIRAPTQVQREFLSAYLGGDGEAPRIFNRNLRSGVRLSFHRILQRKEEGLEFASQLRQMFTNFGVVVNEIRSLPGYTRQDGYRTVEILLPFKLSEENIFALCHRIGFSYCSRKKSKALLVGEYLRIKSQLRDEMKHKMTWAKELRSEGMQVKEIGALLALAPTTVSQWIRRTVKNPLVTAVQVPAFGEWIRFARNGLAEPLLWESIITIEQVELSDVRDLTVQHGNHSFFANGFLVHNCDDHFHLEWLKDMLREQKVYGILSIDSSEAGLGILTGDRLEIVDILTSGVSGKTRKGGQSARRYERSRDMELTYYYHRVGEHATRVFINDEKVTGMIVGGPGPTKEDFLKGEYLHYQLQQNVLAVIDSAYSGREGVRELVEKASDTLKDVRLIEEKKYVQKFLLEVNKPGGLAIYGLPRVIDALQRGVADLVLVSDDINTTKISMKCKNCGTAKGQNTQNQNRMPTVQEMISKPCEKCGRTDYEVQEKDIVDVLEESAFQTGARVEVISSGTEEGNMFRSFGGVGGLLRYRPQ